MPRLLNLMLTLALIYGFAPADFRQATLDHLTGASRQNAEAATAPPAPAETRTSSAEPAALPAGAPSQNWNLATRSVRQAVSDLAAYASAKLAPRPLAETPVSPDEI